MVAFILRFKGTVKETNEPIFHLIRSLIFNAILVLKHFNFFAQSCTSNFHYYVEVKFTKFTNIFLACPKGPIFLLKMSPMFRSEILVVSRLGK